MKPSPTYFFFILLLCGMPALYGQNPARVQAGVDSLGNEIAGKISAVTDSVMSLPARTEAQIRSRLDSLPLDFARGKQSKAAGQIAKAEEKAAKIASQLDSLRAGIHQGFGNPGGLRAGDKPGLGKVKVPALPIEGLPKVMEMKEISGINSEMLKRVQHDVPFLSVLSHPELVSGSKIPGGDLTKRIDEQIRNPGGKVQGLGAQAGLRQVEIPKQP